MEGPVKASTPPADARDRFSGRKQPRSRSSSAFRSKRCSMRFAEGDEDGIAICADLGANLGDRGA